MSNAAAIARMKARLAQTPSRGVDITDEVVRDRSLPHPPASALALALMSAEEREWVLSYGESRRRGRQLELPFGEANCLGGG